MPRSARRFALALLLTITLGSTAFAMAPGEVDFAKLPFAHHGKLVEVTLGRGLLKFASFIARHEDRDAAEIIAGISRVRVNVVGIEPDNRVAMTSHIQSIRSRLSEQGWERVVTVQSADEEDVAIFVKQSDGEMVEGVVVTVIDARNGEAVFVNVAGRIRPDQLAGLGHRLNIEHLGHTKKIRRS